MTHTESELQVRNWIVLGLMALLLLLWLVPIGFLTALLSYEEIKKQMPWLGRIIDSNERIRALVQTSLPSVAVISFNALLPFLLEGTLFERSLGDLIEMSWPRFVLCPRAPRP